jgi:hypothetical protein
VTSLVLLLVMLKGFVGVNALELLLLLLLLLLPYLMAI